MAEAVILNQALNKTIALRATGATTGWQIVKFAVGTGGLNPDGSVKTPSPAQTGLATEIYRKDIESYSRISAGDYEYTMRLLASECAGYTLSEIGLVDEDGMVVCIKNFPGKQKDSDREMVFKIHDTY